MEMHGLSTHTVSTLSEFIKYPNIHLVDYHWLKEQKTLPAKINPFSTIVIGKKITEPEVFELLLKEKFKHVLQYTKSEELNQELKTAIAILTNPVQVFKDPSACFLAYPTKKFCYEFSSSKEKVKILNLLKQHLKILPKSASIKESLMIQADELIMNAVFSALTDNQLIKRNTEALLAEDKKACLFVISDEKHILLGCEDPYGSLDVTKVFEKIQHCYTTGLADSINFGKGGAGIGSYMIFSRSKSYSIFVKPGVKTIVCSVLPLGLSSNALEQKPRSVHLLTSTTPLHKTADKKTLIRQP